MISTKEAYALGAKLANLFSHKVELAGLATLAAPSLYNLTTDKKLNDKATSAIEIAGLGTLATPSILALLRK